MVFINYPTSLPSLQHGVTCLQWDPSGHLLASCANEPHLKLWSLDEDTGLVCAHDILHENGGGVSMIEWCTMPGKNPNPRILFARFAFIFIFVV